MSRAWAASLSMLLAGLALGMWSDQTAERPVDERAGFRVLQGDFHVHTRYSDGLLFPFDAVLVAHRAGLDVIGITEHNIIFPAQMAAWFARRFGGPMVLIGEEVTTHKFHLIALGLTRTASWRLPLRSLLEDIHAQGAVAIAAHPVEMYWDIYAEVIDLLDGAEVVHPIAFRQDRERGFSYQDMVSFFERHQPSHPRLAAIGSSDFHGMKSLGICRTYLFVSEASEEGVLEAIREGRTVAVAPDGRAFGPEALVKSLEAAPIEARSDYSYAPLGWLDLFGRTLSVLGLLGVLAFASRLFDFDRRDASEAST